MDLTDSPEHATLRKAVRAWLKKNVPAWRRDRGGDNLEYDDPKRVQRAKAWQQQLYRAGFVAMGWPEKYGGRGADVLHQTIVNEELVRASAPSLIGMMGINMVGPTLIMHGTEEQRRTYLPKILTADELWCQGYSEPGSGSDLASLKTRAVIDGDHFVVNGQKIWTSGAQYADRMFCLVRTDPEAPKHRGISYVLIDMKSPGITVRPLVQMTGDRGFNEVFFEDVRVPRENLVGKLHDGWTVANSTLFHERNMLASTTRTQILFDGLVKRARGEKRGGKPASKDPIVRQRLADLAIRVETMKLEGYRQLTDAIRKRPPGINASVNKLVTCELNHQIDRAALEIMGEAGWLTKKDPHVRDSGIWPTDYMFALGLIIGGGTAQIQKNIIAERGLGLPREPRPG
jgi:alkylation response protein AidB-like acyl-CoA dehydrogenase